MAAITIRALDEETKRRLKLRAAENNRSMEAEARHILQDALGRPAHPDLTWVEQLIVLAQEAGGGDLPVPPRDDVARAATFA